MDFTGSLLRVRASYAAGALTGAEVGQGPLGPARAGRRQGPGEALPSATTSPARTTSCSSARRGSYLDGSRAPAPLQERCWKKAKLLLLRFHDLRHTFGTRMIAKADIRRVQEWMGHADIQTTGGYLHYAPREEDAQLVA